MIKSGILLFVILLFSFGCNDIQSVNELSTLKVDKDSCTVPFLKFTGNYLDTLVVGEKKEVCLSISDTSYFWININGVSQSLYPKFLINDHKVSFDSIGDDFKYCFYLDTTIDSLVSIQEKTFNYSAILMQKDCCGGSGDLYLVDSYVYYVKK